MTFFDSYPSVGRSIGLDAELVARLRDFIQRRFGPVEKGLQSAFHNALQSIEQAVAGGLSLERLRSGLGALKALVRRRSAALDPAARAGLAIEDELDASADRELELLLRRILIHNATQRLEEHYSSYVFAVDVDVEI